MQKMICCDVTKFEERVNELMVDGYSIIPETIRLTPGVAMQEKATTTPNGHATQRDKRAVGYATAVLQKN